MFLAYALHDPVVPVQHALNLIVAAQQHRLDVEAHVFPQAEHGFALRGLDGTQDQWPALAARWMTQRLRCPPRTPRPGAACIRSPSRVRRTFNFAYPARLI